MATLETNVGNAFQQVGADMATIKARVDLKADLVSGKIPQSQLPSIAIVEYLGTVATQTAMLALVGQMGDWAVRSDRNSVWIIIGADPTQIANWREFTYPASSVLSVNGRQGAVVVDKTDVLLNNVDNTSDVNKPVSTAQATAIATKEPLLPTGAPAGQFLANDKTFKAITSANVGLGSVINSLQVINAGGAVSFGSGLLSARPVVGTAGRFYYATDTKTEYYDNGTSWDTAQPAISGDVTILSGGTTAVLATVNGTIGTFGTAAKVSTVTVNAKGLVTSVVETIITPLAIGAVATSDLGNFNANFLLTYTTARGTL